MTPLARPFLITLLLLVGWLASPTPSWAQCQLTVNPISGQLTCKTGAAGPTGPAGPAGPVSSVAGTANEIAVDTPTGDAVFSLPATLVLTGKTVTLPTSITITTPTIASFTNAAHNHTNAAGGGQITDAALSAAVTVAKGGTGATSFTGSRCIESAADGLSLVVAAGVCGTSGMVYPGAGWAVSTGSAWDTSITPGTGVATFVTTPSSANLRAALTDETGTGIAVFATDPTFTLTDVTTNNATTSQHGWLPKLGGGSVNFLRADGTWAAPGGSGTVTVVSSGSLTSTALVTGGGTQTLQTPSATSTLDSSGNMVLAGTLSSTGTSTGASPPALTAGTGGVDAWGEGTGPSVGPAAGVDVCHADSTANGLLCSFNNDTARLLGRVNTTSTTTTHVAHATAVAGVMSFSAITAGDLPSTLSSGTAITNAALTTPAITGLATGTGVATANTASTLVARDGSGNFAAGTITAALTGTASIAATGDSATSFFSAGIVEVAVGGTGAATLTGLLQGNGTSAFTVITNSTTVGQALRVTGSNTYAWGALDLADTDAVTGVLPASNHPSASDTATGIVELAIASEVTTGTDTSRAITPNALADSTIFGVKTVEVEVFAPGTAATTGDGKAYFRIPAALNGMNLISIKANVYTAGTTGTINIDIARCVAATTGNVCSSTVADVLSTNLTIDSGENDSADAAAAAVINTSNDDVATGQLYRVDIDAIHTTPSQGLILEFTFQLP
jgi:hypothetical protein